MNNHSTMRAIETSAPALATFNRGQKRRIRISQVMARRNELITKHQIKPENVNRHPVLAEVDYELEVLRLGKVEAARLQRQRARSVETRNRRLNQRTGAS